MYEEYTTDAEGGLVRKIDYYETPVIATGLDRYVPTPEVNNNYVNASVMLPRGKTYSKGKAIRPKRDADSKYVGRTNDNPIIDTHECCVNFDDREVRKPTVNVIAESIYHTYDDSINDYFMMYLIVVYWNNDKVVTVTD